MISIRTNPAVNNTRCQWSVIASETDPNTIPAVPPAMPGVNRRIRLVMAIPMPIISRMVNVTGIRMMSSTASEPTSRAANPMTFQIMYITWST